MKAYIFVIYLALMTSSLPLLSIVPSPAGQKMIEESNKIYSGNKYNIPTDQYRQMQNQSPYYNQNYYYQNYPYYQNTPYPYNNSYYYGPAPIYNNPYGYGNNPYGYGYGYYGAPQPYSYDAFPDSTRADALYQYIQSR